MVFSLFKKKRKAPSAPVSPTESQPQNDGMSCTVCLTCPPCEPVLTRCGHMYCWPCIYKWIVEKGASATCPVCQFSISQNSCIPVYNSGSDVELLGKNRNGVPPRPTVNLSNNDDDIFHESVDRVTQRGVSSAPQNHSTETHGSRRMTLIDFGFFTDSMYSAIQYSSDKIKQIIPGICIVVFIILSTFYSIGRILVFGERNKCNNLRRFTLSSLLFFLSVYMEFHNKLNSLLLVFTTSLVLFDVRDFCQILANERRCTPERRKYTIAQMFTDLALGFTVICGTIIRIGFGIVTIFCLIFYPPWIIRVVLGFIAGSALVINGVLQTARDMEIRNRASRT